MNVVAAPVRAMFQRSAPEASFHFAQIDDDLADAAVADFLAAFVHHGHGKRAGGLPDGSRYAPPVEIEGREELRVAVALLQLDAETAVKFVEDETG